MVEAGFRRRGKRIRITLEPFERQILRDLVAELVTLVESDPDEEGMDPLARLVGMGSPGGTPADPVVARLFPDGYGPDDSAAADEFRRFTETDLRTVKTANAGVVSAALGEEGDDALVLDPDQARSWLLVLGDLRLALGTRLEMTEDLDVAAILATEDEALIAHLALYDWLSFLQGSLVEALPRLAT